MNHNNYEPVFTRKFLWRFWTYFSYQNSYLTIEDIIFGKVDEGLLER